MVKNPILIFCLLFVTKLSWSQDSLNLTVPIEIRSEVLQNSTDTIQLSRAQFLTYPGSFDDPSRLLLRHPGFSTANDQANSIIQDGLPPHYVKWSFHGAEILNPNHLANAGSLTDRNSASAGGVNLFSGQVLSGMKYTSSSAPKILNNISGVVDMKLREPFDSRFHINTSLIGLEVGGDRMIPDTDDNFMINYRYSTVGLLTGLGLDFGGEEIKFQDLVAGLKLNNNRWGDYKISLAIGNNSTIHHVIEEGKAETYKDNIESDYRSNYFLLSLHQQKEKGNYSYTNTFNFSRSTTNAERSLFGLFIVPINQAFREANSLFSLHSRVAIKKDLSKIVLGGLINHHRYAIAGTNWHFTMSPYISWDYKMSKHWSFFMQMKLMSETFKGFSTSQPGLEVNLQPSLNIKRKSSKWIVQGSYNRSEQLQTLAIHSAIYRGYQRVPNIPLNNSNLRNTKADHWSLEIQRGVIGIRLFYHHVFDIPSVNSDEYFFTDLTTQDYIPHTRLENEGSANIKGISLTGNGSLGGVHLSGNLTFQDGKQKVAGSSDVNIPYNFGAIVNLLLGKKYTLSNSRYLSINLGFHGRGGAWESKVKTSFKAGDPVTYEVENPYSIQLKNYYRLDLRLVLVRSSSETKYKSVISIDIQNLTNRANDGFHYYDPLSEEIKLQKQLGLIPILGWRVEF